MIGDTGSLLEIFPQRPSSWRDEDADGYRRWRTMVEATHCIADGVLRRAAARNRMTDWDALRTATLIDDENHNGLHRHLPGPWPDVVEAVQRIRDLSALEFTERQMADAVRNT